MPQIYIQKFSRTKGKRKNPWIHVFLTLELQNEKGIALVFRNLKIIIIIKRFTYIILETYALNALKVNESYIAKNKKLNNKRKNNTLVH